MNLLKGKTRTSQSSSDKKREQKVSISNQKEKQTKKDCSKNNKVEQRMIKISYVILMVIKIAGS